MNTNTAATAKDTNAAVIRRTVFQNDHVDYSWMLLGLLAVVLIAAGLRKVFWDKASN